MYKVKLNNLTFTAKEGKSIFESAQDHNILIEHSCLTGRCSSCRATQLDGHTILKDAELGLNSMEQKENIILTCVRIPTSDLILDLDALKDVVLEKPKTFPVKINSLVKIKKDILKLTLRFPPSIRFNFLPGQYVNLIKGDIKRSYSIGGIDNGMIIFYIKMYKDGLMSQYLFNEASENDLLRIEGPYGTFFLRKEEVSNVVFMATGTGIAPVLSILTNKENQELLKSKKVWLFHGGQFSEDLILKNFLETLEINYFPTLSREVIENYQTGYVQEVLISQNINLSDVIVYACGSNNMIESAKAKLIERGLKKNRFLSDAFLESK